MGRLTDLQELRAVADRIVAKKGLVLKQAILDFYQKHEGSTRAEQTDLHTPVAHIPVKVLRNRFSLKNLVFRG